MVSRMANSSSVRRRVLDRTLHGVWRQKGSLLLCSGVVAVAVGYVFLGAPKIPSGSAQSVPAAPDCADAVMAAAIGRGTPPVQQQAYQCMGPELQQHVFQEGLGSQYRTIASAAVSKVSRGDARGGCGTKLIYYAVDAGDQSVGFVVHVGPAMSIFASGAPDNPAFERCWRSSPDSSM
jgi:hypothetical protein